ncbi:hypothetical protein [Streptomonospora halophila]
MSATLGLHAAPVPGDPLGDRITAAVVTAVLLALPVWPESSNGA